MQALDGLKQAPNKPVVRTFAPLQTAAGAMFEPSPGLASAPAPAPAGQHTAPAATRASSRLRSGASTSAYAARSIGSAAHPQATAGSAEHSGGASAAASNDGAGCSMAAMGAPSMSHSGAVSAQQGRGARRVLAFHGSASEELAGPSGAGPDMPEQASQSERMPAAHHSRGEPLNKVPLAPGRLQPRLTKPQQPATEAAAQQTSLHCIAQLAPAVLLHTARQLAFVQAYYDTPVATAAAHGAKASQQAVLLPRSLLAALEAQLQKARFDCWPVVCAHMIVKACEQTCSQPCVCLLGISTMLQM